MVGGVLFGARIFGRRRGARTDVAPSGFTALYAHQDAAGFVYFDTIFPPAFRFQTDAGGFEALAPGTGAKLFQSAATGMVGLY
jgi:hypothetical protein